MLKTYCKIAWRTALRNRSFTAISLGSLVLGITMFFFISLWVKDELSYDAEYADQPNVFRLETTLILPDGQTDKMATVGWPVGRALQAQYPEIEHLTYVREWHPIIKTPQRRFYEKALYADEQFFSVLNYSLQEGSKANALKEPYSVVISPDAKERYFGNGEALGKILMVHDTIPFKVTGVLAPMPANSHLSFDMIASFSSYCSMDPESCQQEFAKGWFDINMYNYVRLRKDASPIATTARISNLVQVAGAAEVKATGFKSTLSLRPVKDIYLYSGMRTARGELGNIRTLQFFLAIGIFILVIACLNFINLSTARSVERAKEIGIQKVLGNSRGRLIGQFLTEAAILCSIAALLSIILLVALLPLYNNFSGKSFTVPTLLSPGNLLLLTGIITVLVPLAGFYPAWVLSSFKPIKVLKGRFSHSTSGTLLRQSLVVLQFVISAGFIMCTAIMWQQMRFMQTQELGFKTDNMLLVDVTTIPWVQRHDKAELFKKELMRRNGSRSITAAGAIPGRTGWDGQFAYPEGKPKEESVIVEYITTDHDYVKTIGLPMIAGRDFLPNSEADTKQSFIINEAAVQTFGWGTPQQAIGKKLQTSGKDGVVVGVVKNYHQHGLQSKIGPVVLSPVGYISVFALRFDNISPAQAIANAEAVWKEVYQDYPFYYRFMDEDFQLQYSKEEKLRSFFGIAAGLSILIGCLGLLGLIIYTAHKRVREIGIRKVLGAGVHNIVSLLSLDLLKLVGIAIVLAIPIAWWVMDGWLQQFAFRIHIQWWVFAASAAGALVIALLTISVQALKAALTNPVKNLRAD